MLVRRTSDPFANPFANLHGLRRQMDEVFNRSLSSFFDDGTETMSSWAPAMDVLERENEIVLRAELPGLSEQDVEITVENNTLSLRGEKRFEEEENEGAYRRVERRYGSFYRSFSLPSTVDRDRIDASFKNGVLEVVLPKVEQAKPRKIAVKAS